MLGRIGFWIAQPGLDAACQRQLVALRPASRDLADVARARKRLELRIAELERQAGQPDDPGRKVADEAKETLSGSSLSYASRHRPPGRGRPGESGLATADVRDQCLPGRHASHQGRLQGG